MSERDKILNGPSKLMCYITLGWKSLPVTNTVAYWARLKVTKKLSVVNVTHGVNVIKKFLRH